MSVFELALLLWIAWFALRRTCAAHTSKHLQQRYGLAAANAISDQMSNLRDPEASLKMREACPSWLNALRVASKICGWTAIVMALIAVAWAVFIRILAESIF